MRRQVIVYMSPVFILLSTFTSIARLKWLSLLGNAFMTIALGSAIVASLSHVSEQSIATATGLEPGFTEINLFVGSIFFTFEGLGTVMPVCNAFADSERFPGVLVKSMGALATSFLIVGACVSLGYPCSHVADVAPEWPALLAATTTATPMLRADPSYPTVALFHVSLTLRKILKRRAAESPTSRSA